MDFMADSIEPESLESDLGEIFKEINERQIPKRVKIYHLVDDYWKDQGTGYCIGAIEENKAFLIVENENKENDILLKTRIEGNTQYQKQQDTLIVWTDVEGVDIALSFQEPEGCALVCEFIIQVQRFIEKKISLVAVLSNDENGATEIICGPIEYPTNPSMSYYNLCYILSVLQMNSNSMAGRTEISKFLNVNKLFISSLIDVFQESEETHNLQNLHKICAIVKTLILYNENPIFDLLFNEEKNFFNIIGMLEYDPDFPTYKSKYREYLQNESKFKEIIPIDDPEMKKFIISTFNFQFLKDVVLARLLDDPTVNSISTLIYFNQVEIINYLQNNKHFLLRLFNLYNNDKEEQREINRDGVRMIHQYVVIAKSLQPTQRSDFFKALIRKGLFKMIKFALKDAQVNIRVIGTELIVAILEHDAALINGISVQVDEVEELTNRSDSDTNHVRSDSDTDEDDADKNTRDTNEVYKKRKINEKHSVKVSSPHKLDLKTTTLRNKISALKDNLKNKQDNAKEGLPIILSNDVNLLLVLSDLLIDEKDQGLKTQAFQAIKALLDPNNTSMSFERHTSKNVVFETDAYITSFYDLVAPVLFSPITNLCGDNVDVPRFNYLLLYHLCDIITLCAREHKSKARSFILENQILEGIVKLQEGKLFKKSVQLASIRCLKNIILLNDELYTQAIISNNLLHNSMKLLVLTSGKINLVNSTVLDLLDIIIVGNQGNLDKTNFKRLAQYLHDNFKQILLDISSYCNSGRAVLELCGDSPVIVKEVPEVIKSKPSKTVKRKISLSHVNFKSVRSNEQPEKSEPSVQEHETSDVNNDTPEKEDIEMSVSPLRDDKKLRNSKLSKLKFNFSGKLSSSLNSLTSAEEEKLNNYNTSLESKDTNLFDELFAGTQIGRTADDTQPTPVQDTKENNNAPVRVEPLGESEHKKLSLKEKFGKKFTGLKFRGDKN